MQRNAQVQAANNQTAAANATIANAAAALSTLQGQADENGMISAESLSAVIGSLTQADAGVAGVDGISADSYTGQAQAVVSAVSGQLASAQASLNDTASSVKSGSSRTEQWSRDIKNKIF